MPKIKRTTFVIARILLDKPIYLTGFLDMMRYDAATIIDTSHDCVVLQTTGHLPTAGRWASFGLYILAEQHGDYPDTRALMAQAKDRLPS